MEKSGAAQMSFRPTLVFEPDILTSQRYFETFRQKHGSYAERRLMFAVLSDAIECFQKYTHASNRRNRRLFTNAATWINSRDASWPYSFEHICDVLEINADYLRIGLMRWRLEHQSGDGSQRRIREPLRYQYRVKHNRVRP